MTRTRALDEVNPRAAPSDPNDAGISFLKISKIRYGRSRRLRIKNE